MRNIILNKLEEVGSSHISRSIIAMGYKNNVIELTTFLSDVKFSQRIWHIINDLYEFPHCTYCGKSIDKFRNLEYGYNKFCCQRCGTLYNEEKRKQTKKKKYGDENYNNPLKAKETNIQKYGVEHFNQLENERQRCSDNCHLHDDDIIIKKKNTWLNHYGVEHPVKSKQILNKIKKSKKDKYGYEYFNKDKSKETCLKRYGNEEPLSSSIIRDKIKATNIKEYGVENVFQRADIQKQIKKTNKTKYGTEYPMQSEIIKEKTKQKIFENFYKSLFQNRLQNKFVPLFKMEDYVGVYEFYKFKCLTCGNEFKAKIYNGIIPRCLICNPYSISNPESEVKEYVKSLEMEFIENDRKILNGLELDLYIPSKDLAIEFDGLYWHSEQQGKDRKYHLNKTLECEKQNIRLIHIFEDEWIYKQQIIKNRLKNILGLNKYKIYGRKCTVKEIKNDVCKKFINKYHIQGNGGSSVKLGAFYKNRLVAVMTFGKRRVALGKKKTEEGEFELLRYVTVANFNVIGGAGKLLKYFERNYNPSKIISYADRRWSQGNLYRQLGFTETHISKPNYWYIMDDIRKHRFNFRKNVLNKKLALFDETLTEYQNMQLNGYTRIWDCGNYVFEKGYDR